MWLLLAINTRQTWNNDQLAFPLSSSHWFYETDASYYPNEIDTIRLVSGDLPATSTAFLYIDTPGISSQAGCNIGCKTLFSEWGKLPLKLTCPAGTLTCPATLLHKGEIGHCLPSGASQCLVQLAPLLFFAEFTCNLQRGQWLCCTVTGLHNELLSGIQYNTIPNTVYSLQILYTGVLKNLLYSPFGGYLRYFKFVHSITQTEQIQSRILIWSILCWRSHG